MRAFIVSDPLFSATETVSSSAPDTNPSGVHVLLHPSAIRTAPPLPESGREVAEKADSLDVYVQDVLTVPASLAGLPAISVPLRVGRSEKEDGDQGDGWPIGASLVGQWGCEEMVLRVGRAIEEVEGGGVRH